MSERILTNNNFSIFAEMVAAPSKPIEYNESAMERLMVYLNPYVEHVKNVKFKYHARNRIELIQFQSREEREAYDNAYEDYLAKVAEIEAREGFGGGSTSGFMILVQFLKFRQAAELIRAPYLARRMYDIVVKKERSAICACNFKETIVKVVTILVNDYNISRDDISLIWGGLTEKKKGAKVLSSAEQDKIKELFSSEDFGFLSELGIEVDEKQFGLDTKHSAEAMEERASLRESLQLGAQSKNARQWEIDKFQKDLSRFCLFTFKSGGVGLSLHQETPERRQRESLLAPTYSAIELVQGLGRAARLTSCSDTEQTIIFYAGTIETRVSVIASQKLKCLSKAVQKKESWDSVLYGVGKIEDSTEDNVEEDEDSSDGVLSGGSIVDEEDSDSE